MYLGRRETPNLAYPPAFKLEVALHAQKYSQYAAAKIFSVSSQLFVYIFLFTFFVYIFCLHFVCLQISGGQKTNF